jgi:hypothetical protein
MLYTGMMDAGMFLNTVDKTAKYGGSNGVSGNGSIDKNELQGLANDSTATQANKDAAKWLLGNNNGGEGSNFAKYDGDDSGVLSLDEAKKAIGAYNVHVILQKPLPYQNGIPGVKS